MIRDASSVSAATVIERDVCIVGAGAAGISLALELDRRGISVCLLESGGHVLEAAAQDLYWGEAPRGDLIAEPDYLWHSRLRFLGGTTNHWAGYCSPLDPIDFETRSWVPNSGWPFGRETLEPWYQRAATWLEIPPWNSDFRDPHVPSAPLGASGLQTALYSLSPPTRFGARYRSDLQASRRILLLLHSNAVAVSTDDSGVRAQGVEVSDLGGTRYRVRAGTTVLAAGALENARLLLLSNRVHASGLGNQHDQVGRYFMDHFYGSGIAKVGLLRPSTDLSLYAKPAQNLGLGVMVLGVLRLSDELQRKHQLLNVQFRPVPEAMDPDPFQEDLMDLSEEWDRAAGSSKGGARGAAFIEVGTEIAPSPDNRVTLARERDALGLPRLSLRAATSPFDREALVRAVGTLAEALGAGLAARVRVVLDESRPFASLIAGSHHIGTTRMHEDPRRGVVDADARVHGVSNLYVAGSSVFSTSGRSNPTFTLVALALRLADHLAGRGRG